MVANLSRSRSRPSGVRTWLESRWFWGGLVDLEWGAVKGSRSVGGGGSARLAGSRVLPRGGWCRPPGPGLVVRLRSGGRGRPTCRCDTIKRHQVMQERRKYLIGVPNHWRSTAVPVGGGGYPEFGASRSEGDLDADGNERAWRYLLSRGESVGSDAGGARSLGLSRSFSAVLLF